jgi:hypothetical protein
MHLGMLCVMVLIIILWKVHRKIFIITLGN